MGEWSDYFEDFPEENPANWVNGAYVGPAKARAHHEMQAKIEATRKADQDHLDSSIAKMIAAGEERQKRKSGND